MSQTDGLKDTIACDTRISQIVDDSLSYAGYNISELVEHHASFEEVIYLLWHLHLPTQIELKHFEEDLRANYAISDAVEQCILIQSRKHLHPMSVLRSTVSLLGVYNVHAEEASLEATYAEHPAYGEDADHYCGFCQTEVGSDSNRATRGFGLCG